MPTPLLSRQPMTMAGTTALNLVGWSKIVMPEYFWVKCRSGEWIIAERRHLDRWFVCGIEHIMHRVKLDTYRSSKNADDIVEIGQRIVCPYA